MPNLCIGFVIYSSKSNLQNLNKAIKAKFAIQGRKTEHLNCELDDLESFVIQYLEIMSFPYQKEDIQKLRLLNIYLKS